MIWILYDKDCFILSLHISSKVVLPHFKWFSVISLVVIG